MSKYSMEAPFDSFRGKVCTTFREQKLPEPTFENFMGGTLVQIQRTTPDQVNDQINNYDDQVNDQIKNLQLTENQAKVLLFIKEHSRIKGQADQVNDQVNDQVKQTLTTQFIAQQLHLSYSTVKRALSVLKRNDIIIRIGSDKIGYWSINKTE